MAQNVHPVTMTKVPIDPHAMACPVSFGCTTSHGCCRMCSRINATILIQYKDNWARNTEDERCENVPQIPTVHVWMPQHVTVLWTGKTRGMKVYHGFQQRSTTIELATEMTRTGDPNGVAWQGVNATKRNREDKGNKGVLEIPTAWHEDHKLYSRRFAAQPEPFEVCTDETWDVRKVIGQGRVA